MAKNQRPLKVTSLEQIKQSASMPVELPGWNEDEPFVARLKRITLFNLIQGGTLPNELLGIAHKMLTSEGKYNAAKEQDPEEFKKFTALVQLVAKSCLVEPTYDEIVEAGGYLTQEQLTAIFTYSNLGMKSLILFRKRQGSDEESGTDREGLGEGTE